MRQPTAKQDFTSVRGAVIAACLIAAALSSAQIQSSGPEDSKLNSTTGGSLGMTTGIGSTGTTGALAPLAGVYISELDFDSLPATDSAYFANDENYPEIEFEQMWLGPLPTPAPGVVYDRNNIMDLKITLRNDSGINVTGTFDCLGIRIAPPPELTGNVQTYIYLNLPTIYPNTTVNLPHDSSQEFIWNDIELPNYVTLGDFEVDYELSLSDGFSNYDNGSNGYTAWTYIWMTEDVPHGHQEVPWTDLLDLTCRWAYGLTAWDVPEAICNSMFDSEAFRFDFSTTSLPSNFISSGGVFDLTSFLGQMGSPISVTSLDGTSFFSLCLEGQGVTHSMAEFRHASSGVDFVTNLVCPTGSDASSNGNYRHIRLDMHPVVLINGVSVVYAYDVMFAHKLDLAGSTHKLPATQWPADSYWQVYSPSPPTAYGLVYRRFLTASADYEQSFSQSGVSGMETVLDPLYPAQAESYDTTGFDLDDIE